MAGSVQPVTRPVRRDVGGRLTSMPVHPLLAATFPMLALYSRNMGEIQAAEIVRPLLLALAATAAAWVVAGLLMRNSHKGALLATSAALAFFSYGHVLRVLPGALHGLVMPAFALVLVAVSVAVWRAAGPIRPLTAVLNMAALVLVAPSAWTVATTTTRVRQTAIAHPEAPRPKRVVAKAVADLPDVYYIVLDAYARTDILRTFYSFDNQPFERALEDRGFTITRSSRSNYGETPLCVSSTLNMQYLDEVAGRDRGSTDTEPLRRMIDDNEVARVLSRHGHRYVYVGSGAGQTRHETADVILDAGARASSFEGQVMGLTAIDAAPASKLGQYTAHRQAVSAAFANLSTAAKMPYPKFVFAHILAPHPPFVFGANGEESSPDRRFTYDDGNWLVAAITAAEYRRGYIAQLRYTNRRVLGAIDAIMRSSKREPIIILQGDHGSRLTMNWEDVALTDVREPFSILNAYRVPARVRRALYPTITPVNTFRVVLSGAFDEKYDRLPDRTYYSRAFAPYDFTEVTRVMDAAFRSGDRPKIATPKPSGDGLDPEVALPYLRR